MTIKYKNKIENRKQKIENVKCKYENIYVQKCVKIKKIEEKTKQRKKVMKKKQGLIMINRR